MASSSCVRHRPIAVSASRPNRSRAGSTRRGSIAPPVAKLLRLEKGEGQLIVSLWLGQDRRVVTDWPTIEADREVA